MRPWPKQWWDEAVNQMAANKHLGKGLDLLLSASSVKTVNETREKLDVVHIEKQFSKALAADDGDQSYEAYYLYRTLIEYVETRLPLDDKAISLITSQALNNAAIILHEAGHHREARDFLKRACDICPDNGVARENLNLTSQ